MSSSLNFIDLFAGAGGLSEGFIQNGFNPVAHVEMDSAACDTLKTRQAFHYLISKNDLPTYTDYLQNKIQRDVLWGKVPAEILNSVVNSEISKQTVKTIFSAIDEQRYSKKIDIIIGGPPCQAYSFVGRSRDPNGMRWDKRNFLFRRYAEFLVYFKPKYFVFENVLGLFTAGGQKYLKEMLALFEEIGFSVDFRILNAEEYGVLQKRKRVIIIGRKGKRKFHFPTIEKVDNLWQIKKDLLYDLPALNPGEEINKADYIQPVNGYLKKYVLRNGVNFTTQHICRPHNERDLEIYSIAIDKWVNCGERLKYSDLPKQLQTHKNVEAFLDRFKVVDPSGHSHTLVAHISKDGHHYIYPDLNQIRSISVREAARIQSFPDDFYFEGGRTAAFKQIGNAVPPLMAQSIANKIKSFI